MLEFLRSGRLSDTRNRLDLVTAPHRAGPRAKPGNGKCGKRCRHYDYFMNEFHTEESLHSAQSSAGIGTIRLGLKVVLILVQ